MSRDYSYSQPHGKQSKTAAGNTNAAELPALDLIKLIELVESVATGEKSPQEAAKEFAKPYVPFAKVYVKSHAKDWIKAGMQKAGMGELSDTDFADQLIAGAEGVARRVHQYMLREIDDAEFVAGLGDVEMQEMAVRVLSALGIHEKLGVANAEEIFNLSPKVVAYAASMTAFEEIQKAHAELAREHEKRLQIEVASEQTIRMIRQYRTEMERIVSNYLRERLETFETAFAAMDQAMMEADVDGYIRGNVEIQNILGYKVQFTNQEEFDELMLSDEAFKL